MKVFVTALCLTLFAISNADPTFNMSKVLDKMLEGYDKRLRPNWGGEPVEVGISMYFLRIFDISTKDQMVKTDAYFRNSWTDRRLAFDAPPNVQSISLGPDAMKSFWEPDTFFTDGFVKYAHDNNVFFRINRDGTVMKSVRVMTKTKFPMDLTYFPLDQQTFSISLESYGSSSKDIKYKWAKGNNSVGMEQGAGQPEFRISNSAMRDSSIQLSSGLYSRLTIDITAVRSGGYYCRHFYLPAIISFLLVWAAFWFPVTAPAVRVLLILVSFLTGNYLLNETKDHLPTVGYSTMLERYLVFGQIMAFLAVVECAIVACLYERTRKMHGTVKCDLETNLLESGDAKEPSKISDQEKENKTLNSYFSRSAQYVMNFRQHRRTYHKVDLFFRALFPIIFVIYNIWYWVAFPSTHSG